MSELVDVDVEKIYSTEAIDAHFDQSDVLSLEVEASSSAGAVRCGAMR
jgi:hypothetical protein